jgi:hypothetical protein
LNTWKLNTPLLEQNQKPVKRLDESTGYIDLLWKDTILVEHKSKGKDLDSITYEWNFILLQMALYLLNEEKERHKQE